MAAQVTRRFHRKVYVLAAIQAAVTAYEDFATMDVERGDDAWTVSFANVDEDYEPEMIASEFANYVLAGTVERKR